MFQPYSTQDLPLHHSWRNVAGGQTWVPLIDITILHRGYESKVLRAVVDSGCTITIINASFGELIGIPVRSGPSEKMTGFTGSEQETIYFHHIQLRVAGTSVRTMAGFCYGLPVQALLGRHGFFDHFKITFDPLRRGMQIDRTAECYDSI